MSNFDKYSNYKEECSFSSVVFGANAPVLEVELNELQQILNSKISKIARSIGNRVEFLESPVINRPTITFPSLLVVEETGGNFIEIKNASVDFSTTNKEIYLKIEEKEVTGDSEIHYYGNPLAESIDNPIKDSRFPFETTRRKYLETTLVAGVTIPNNTPTTRHISIATVNSAGSIDYADYTGYESIQSFLSGIKSGSVTVSNALRLGGKSAGSYALAENLGFKTKFGDVANYTEVSSLISSIPDNTLYYGYATNTPNWFPKNITANKCILKVVVVRVGTQRMAELELVDTSDVTKKFIGSVNAGVFSGWYTISMTKVV